MFYKKKKKNALLHLRYNIEKKHKNIKTKQNKKNPTITNKTQEHQATPSNYNHQHVVVEQDKQREDANVGSENQM
jgi:hypothetical protein